MREKKGITPPEAASIVNSFMTRILPLLALALAPLQEGKVELRWKWEKGREWVYQTTKKSVTDLGGAPMIQDESNRLQLTVTDLGESGEATIRVKYLAAAVR